MRYRESSARSAELARLLLSKLARNGGNYHPTAYAVWYEYLACTNEPLKAAMDRLLVGNRVLSLVDLERLHSQHISGATTLSAELLHDELVELQQSLKKLTFDAAIGSATYAQGLKRCQEKLAGDSDKGAVEQRLDKLLQHNATAIAGVQSVHEQISRNSQLLDELMARIHTMETEALRDPLTTMMNRRGFDSRVAALLADRPRKLANCSLLIADVDLLKRINYRYGHGFGDQVLGAIAATFTSLVREPQILARLSGDKFGILMPDVHTDVARAFADELRAAVARKGIQTAGAGSPVEKLTLSMGVATGLTDETLEQLSYRAEQALYQAKEAGRDCIRMAGTAAQAPTVAPVKPQTAIGVPAY